MITENFNPSPPPLIAAPGLTNPILNDLPVDTGADVFSALDNSLGTIVIKDESGSSNGSGGDPNGNNGNSKQKDDSVTVPITTSFVADSATVTTTGATIADSDT